MVYFNALNYKKGGRGNREPTKKNFREFYSPSFYYLPSIKVGGLYNEITFQSHQ